MVQKIETINPELLAILACPKCKSTVSLVGDDRIVCEKCTVAYPIRDGIPIMLIDEAAAFPG